MDWAFYTDKLIPALNTGLVASIIIIVPSALLGLAWGVLLGVLRVFGPSWLRKAGDAYTALFRGVPLVVQLFIVCYGLPKIGLTFDRYGLTVTSFVLCSASYHSEYIRGALLSIRQGQYKAAQALGFSTAQMLRSILAPQAFRRALSGCGNEIIYLIKYSSLAYITSYEEITAVAKRLGTQEARPLEVFMVAGAYYLLLTTIATWYLGRVEKRLYVPGFGRQQ